MRFREVRNPERRIEDMTRHMKSKVERSLDIAFQNLPRNLGAFNMHKELVNRLNTVGMDIDDLPDEISSDDNGNEILWYEYGRDHLAVRVTVDDDGNKTYAVAMDVRY